MRIVALVESEDHVCCRYRIAAFRDSFAAAGHRLDIRPLPRTSFDLESAAIWPMRTPRSSSGSFAALDSRATRRRVPAHLRLRRRGLAPRFVLATRIRRCQRPAIAVIAAPAIRSSPGTISSPLLPECTSLDRVVVIRLASSRRSTRSNRIVMRNTSAWVGSQSTLRGLEQFEAPRDWPRHSGNAARSCDRFLTIPNLPVDEA